MSDSEKRGEEGLGTGVFVKATPKTKAKTKKPSMYKVLMLNDDCTPMESVVHILGGSSTRTGRRRPALSWMCIGGGRVCGIYTYEVAEAKVTQVMDFARQHQHPLRCTLEKD